MKNQLINQIIEIGNKEKFTQVDYQKLLDNYNPESPSTGYYFLQELAETMLGRKIRHFKFNLRLCLAKEGLSISDLSSFIKGYHLFEKQFGDFGFGSPSISKNLIDNLAKIDQKKATELYNWIAEHGGNHYIKAKKIGFKNIINQPVSLLELLKEYEASDLDYELPVVLGENAEEKVVFADLVELGHILIAGETGSGKSSFLHQLIWTLITKFSPDILELLLIDMKRVEFGIYKDIPHLVTSPIFDPDLAIEWIKKNIDQKKKNKLNNRYSIIIIDTFSDLTIDPVREKFIKLVNEIVSMSSKPGIHLIMCDSRVDNQVFDQSFISGFKTKMCFKVVDDNASKLIISSGAGKDLLGKGDVLLLMESHNEPIRLQTPHISFEEIKEKIQKHEHLSRY